MENNTSARENILKKIGQALVHTTPVPFPDVEAPETFFQHSGNELEIEFAENFTKLLGRFSYCENENELAQQLNILCEKRQWKQIYCCETILKDKLQANSFQLIQAKDITNCEAAITGCEALVARTGSIMMSSAQESGRVTSVYAPVHICIAYSDQLVYDIKDALALVKNKYATMPSFITMATGPSRTADIEKTLVTGIHGPKEVFCFLVES